MHTPDPIYKRSPMVETPFQPYRILIAEDHYYTLNLIKETLSQAGFDVLTAMTGEEALQTLRKHGLPHLAVVDLQMPVLDGLGFCKIVHQFSDLPIIILTAINDEDVIVESIEQYAEDYLVKPFKPRELVARINRVLKRLGDFGYTLEPLVKVNQHLQIDFAGKRLMLNEKEVILTPIETKLLYLLIRHAGRTVTTNFLLNRLWNREQGHENHLRVHIHNLRQKIEQNPAQPFYIVSERGAGYSFPPAIRSTVL